MTRQGFIAYFNGLERLIQKLGLAHLDEAISANEKRIGYFTALGDTAQLASLRGTAEILTARKIAAPKYLKARKSLKRMFINLTAPDERGFIEYGDENESELAELIAEAQRLVEEAKSHEPSRV